MADQVVIYISAASDLRVEREILGRAVTQVPVTLGWRVVQSPLSDVPVDLDAVARAGVHFLLIGSDIRAPIGQEWIAARRAGRQPLPLLKQNVLQTAAAQDFVRFIGQQVPWQTFKDGSQLRLLAHLALGDHLLGQAGYYALSPAELEGLRAWRAQLSTRTPAREDGTRGATGEDAVILSPQRYVPSEGALIQPSQAEEEPDDDG